MPNEDIMAEQESFLREGGLFKAALRAKRKNGEIATSYDPSEHPYPKVLYFDRGELKVPRSTETVDRKTINWEETVHVRDAIIVHTEDEEDRVRAGGATDAQSEEDRQDLIQRARNLGIRAVRDWSVVRLRREIAARMDAPEPEPADPVGALEAELANLRKMQAMREEIASLRAQMEVRQPDNADALRDELRSLGVEPDKRWGAARLREELDKATAPAAAVAA